MSEYCYDPFSYGFGNDDHFRELRARSPEFRDFVYALGLLPVEWWRDYQLLRAERSFVLMCEDSRREIERLERLPRSEMFFEQLELW